ncbi:unnamed protein product [Sphagnum compactum]
MGDVHRCNFLLDLTTLSTFDQCRGGTERTRSLIKDRWPEPSKGRQKGKAKERPKDEVELISLFYFFSHLS